MSYDSPTSPPGPTSVPDQTSPPDVSVVIVSWNVCELLRDCVRSVVDQTRRSYEVIVVDNAARI